MQRQEMKELRVQAAPVGFNPIESQRALQKDIRARMERLGVETTASEYRAQTVGELTNRVLANAMALQQELAETIDWLPWKSWKNYGTLPDEAIESHEELVNEVKFEVIDMMHFLLNMAIALGMSWDEVLDIFYTKQRENRARQERGY